jgi:hypothetical protein
VEFGNGNYGKRCVTPCRMVVENLENEGRLEMCAVGGGVNDGEGCGSVFNGVGDAV